MPFTQLTISEPIPDLKCLNCGQVHKYDGVGDWQGCIVLKDSRLIPAQVACWCDEACLSHWLDSPGAKELFPTM
jgi:hypothetical protein